MPAILAIVPRHPVTNMSFFRFLSGFRGGCKICIVSKSGEAVFTGKIYPTGREFNLTKTDESMLRDQIKRFQVTAIAIGNGTASRETLKLMKSLISRGVLVSCGDGPSDKKISCEIVSEQAASIFRYLARFLTQDNVLCQPLNLLLSFISAAPTLVWPNSQTWIRQ